MEESVAPEAAPEAVEASEEVSEQIEDSSQEDVVEGEEFSEGDSPAEKQLAELKRQLSLKIDGEEIDYDIDFEDEKSVEKLKRDLQEAFASKKRFQQASEISKKAEYALQLLQENPEMAMREMGIDPEQFAAGLIEKKIKEMEMSPEEKAQVEKEKRLQELEEKLAKAEQEKEEAHKRQMQQKYVQEIDNSIANALQEHPDLPKSDYTVKRIVDTLYRYTEAGIDVKVEDVIPTVKSQLKKEMNQMMELMPDEVFRAWLGQNNEKRLKEIRKKTAKSLPKTQKVDVRKVDTAESKNKKQITMKDFFKNLGSGER